MGETPDHQKKDHPARVHVHYLKSPMFRTIHADGVFGGVTPHLDIQMAFWNEREPIPQTIEVELNEDRVLGPEVPQARIGKKGLVREVDANILMDLDTAIAFRNWLDSKIENLKDAIDQNRSVKK